MPASCDNDLLDTLQQRFDNNMSRHPDAGWPDVAKRLGAHPDKLEALRQMEDTGGEPDLIGRAADRAKGGAIFGDYRYGRVFVYHNGVRSYYAARDFRAILKV